VRLGELLGRETTDQRLGEVASRQAVQVALELVDEAQPDLVGNDLVVDDPFLGLGIATVSASRLCISTTSIPRSRIFWMKSKWSRLAFSTQSTSSKRRESQLEGVRRWWARPGAHTSTLRSCPTSE